MDRTSIIKWRKYLSKHSWLIDTGKMAADNWIALGKRPSPGSYQTPVYRVDNPTSKTKDWWNVPITMHGFTRLFFPPVEKLDTRFLVLILIRLLTLPLALIESLGLVQVAGSPQYKIKNKTKPQN